MKALMWASTGAALVAVGYLITKLSLVTPGVEIVQGSQNFLTLVQTFEQGGGVTSQTILGPNRSYTNLTDHILT